MGVFYFSSLDGIERDLPDVVLAAKNSEEANSDPKKGDPASAEAQKTILGGCISPDGRLMALTDDRKQLTLWNCDDWSLVRQWALQRRANRVIFSNDSSEVLVAGISPL